MRLLLPALFTLSLALVPQAQTACGPAGVTVQVSPAVAVPGEVVTVTLVNNSSQTVTFPSSCLFGGVHVGPGCAGSPVLGLFCLAILVPVPPGGSLSQSWDQLDSGGAQVPDGVYSFSIVHDMGSCCPTVTIAPAPVAGNGQGINLNAQTAPPAVLGSPWSASVTVHDPATPASGVLALLFSPNPLASGPRLSFAGGPVTELLLGAPLSQPCAIASYAGGTGTACAGTLIPNDPALLGSPWCTQLALGSPAAGFTLTNSLCGNVF